MFLKNHKTFPLDNITLVYRKSQFEQKITIIFKKLKTFHDKKEKNNVMHIKNSCTNSYTNYFFMRIKSFKLIEPFSITYIFPIS
jgi:hypothetical protein